MKGGQGSQGKVREGGRIPEFLGEISSFRVVNVNQQIISIFKVQVLRLILFIPNVSFNSTVINQTGVFIFSQNLWSQIFSDSHFTVCSVSSWPKHPLKPLYFGPEFLYLVVITK